MFLIALIALWVSLYYTTLSAIHGHWCATAGNICGALAALYALVSATIWLPF